MPIFDIFASPRWSPLRMRTKWCHHLKPPHAQSLFPFPIGFGINSMNDLTSVCAQEIDFGRINLFAFDTSMHATHSDPRASSLSMVLYMVTYCALLILRRNWKGMQPITLSITLSGKAIQQASKHNLERPSGQYLQQGSAKNRSSLSPSAPSVKVCSAISVFNFSEANSRVRPACLEWTFSCWQSQIRTTTATSGSTHLYIPWSPLTFFSYAGTLSLIKEMSFFPLFIQSFTSAPTPSLSPSLLHTSFCISPFTLAVLRGCWARVDNNHQCSWKIKLFPSLK